MILGHQKQWNLLKRLAEADKIPQAFLFFGEEKLGKKTLAIEFVKYLNCQNDKKPCQTCRSCQDIERGIYPDFSLISFLKKGIQISQIRDLIWKLSLRSYSAPFKAAVIDKAHLMTRAAQSCFLKTLEEPKGKTLLILVTEYPEMLLPTILSRVQRLKFFPVKHLEIENYLKTKGATPGQASELSSLSLGRPGLALDFFSDLKKVSDFKQKTKEIEKLSVSDLAFRFQYAKNLSSQSPQTIKEVLYIWLQYFRKILLSEEKNSLPKIKKILKLIQSTNFLVSTTNVNSKLALEILLMEL